MKNEHPILFSGKMVNAILKNEKEVTRRIVEPQPPNYIDYFHYWKNQNYFGGYMSPGEPVSHPGIKSKYWPGLKLWVRETWGIIAYNNNSGYEISVRYNADNSEKYHIDLDDEELWERLITKEKIFLKTNYKYCTLPNPDKCTHFYCPGCENHISEKPILWRPSIFMLRAVSRINLEIVDVRMERLHELDDAEARLEGCKNREEFIKVWDGLSHAATPAPSLPYSNKKIDFTWATNPWVYRVQFRRVNI